VLGGSLQVLAERRKRRKLGSRKSNALTTSTDSWMRPISKTKTAASKECPLERPSLRSRPSYGDPDRSRGSDSA